MRMITLDETREKLTRMGLKHTADNLSALLEHAVKEEMSLHGFLDSLIAEELQRREEERIKMYLRLSCLPPGKTLENFDFSFQPTISRRKVETLATSEYITRCENVLFLGPPGVGKTHLAAALGVKAIECGFRVLFKRGDDLMRMLKEDIEQSAARINRRRYHRAHLLIIDEVGFQPLSVKEANLFFHLISKLYEKTSIIITSNKAFRDWPKVFADDEVIVVAILDRLLHHSHVINIRGRSWRLKEMEEAIQFTTSLEKEGHEGPGKAMFSPKEEFSSSEGKVGLH